jgi:hypothetical protein
MDNKEDINDIDLSFLTKYKDKQLEEEDINKIIKYYLKILTNDNNYETSFESYYHIESSIMSIEEYLKRLIGYLDISQNLIIISLIYIDRLKIKFNYDNIHKLLLTSLLITNKFLEDDNINNNYWANCGGIPLNYLNKLEIKFLKKINYILYVNEEEFIKKYEEIFLV